MATQLPRGSHTESFAGLLLRHRGRTGLSQRELAERLGTTRRSIQDWESGAYYPSAERLQVLIRVMLESGGLTVGHEAVEVHELWAAVLREAPRMHTPLDNVWLETLLAERAPQQTSQASRDAMPLRPTESPAEAGRVERHQDWGEAPNVLGFMGRAEELATVREWVLKERCRLVAVLGMGGIGKTALTSRLAQDAVPAFHRVYWRSLRDALPANEWLAGAIGFLSAHQLVPPKGESAQLTALVQLLRDRPNLLVLDNFETVLEPSQQEGRYRDGFAAYGSLLQAIGETRHQSCLVVTSREAPPELAVLAGGAVRAFQLGGLGAREGRALLADKQLSGSDPEWTELIARLSGNGLALKVVGESIEQVFGGDIAMFLKQAGSSAMSGGIRRLLAEQIDRSSSLERKLLRVLAVEREPVTLADLIARLGPRAGQGSVVEAVGALRRRSLVERAATAGMAAFTLHSVVLEYVTDRLVEEVSGEIARGQPLQLSEQSLVGAQAKDYVRQTQERLIAAPILQEMHAQFGVAETERRLLGLLGGWRHRPEAAQGFGPGNVVNLLRLERGDLRGLDFSGLTIRQAYLAGIEAQDASFVGAHLAESVLGDAFQAVTAIAMSADGTRVAAGTIDGEVRAWRTADRTPVLSVHGHTGPVQGIALSADGQTVASGGYDGTMRLWATEDGRPIATLEGHTGGVIGMALSADARIAAGGGQDSAVWLWSIEDRRRPVILEGHTAGVWGVALSADGRTLASGGLDSTVRVWDVEGGRLRATLEGHTGGICAVSVSADGRTIASASLDGTVRLWAAEDGRALATLQGHTAGVWGVALSADGQAVASSSQDKSVRLWDAKSGRCRAVLEGHTNGGIRVAVSADGRTIVSGGFDGTVRLWAGDDGGSLATLRGDVGGVWGVAVSADGRAIVSGGFDGIVRFWAVEDGQCLAALRGDISGVWGVAISADGRTVVGGSLDGPVRVWAAEDGQSLATLEGHTSEVWGVAVSADGRTVASGGFDGTVRLWAVQDGRPLATLPGGSGGVWGVALSADGKTVAGGGVDGTVRLWAIKDVPVLTSLVGHTGSVIGVALSGDGQTVASGSQDGTVRLWAADGRCLATLEGHTAAVWGVALSADGKTVASSSSDGTVRVWAAENLLCLATLEGHAAAVWGVGLSADGKTVASGSLDGTVKLWSTDNFRLMHTLRPDRRYERMDITHLSGVTAAQKSALLALGAVDKTSAESTVSSPTT